MRILLLILVPVVLLLACALIVLWVPLPGSFPPPFSDGRNLRWLDDLLALAQAGERALGS